MRILPLALALASIGWSASLKDQLSLFATLSPTDSVTALHTRTGTLEATILDRKTGATRTLSTPLNETARDNILAEARAEKVPVDDSVKAPVATSQSPTTNAMTLSNQYRRGYFWNELGTSSYLYGAGLPIVFWDGLSPLPAIGLGILAVPVEYLGHSAFAANREWTQANVEGVEQAVNMEFWGSGALGAIIGGDDFNALRVAFGAAMIGYPFAIRYGYENGASYPDNPGRLTMRKDIASDAAVAALFVPYLFVRNVTDGDGFVRMEGAVALAGYAGGFVLSNTWKPDQHVALGNPDGIGQWGILGFAAGEEVAALADVQGQRSNVALPLAGYIGGLGAGWFAFQHREDPEERAFYNALGLGGGELAGLGVTLMTGAYNSRGGFTSCMVGGAFAGYLVSNALTANMQEHPKSSNAWIRDVTIDPMPILALSAKPDGSPERVWQVPGLQVRFR
ncbi:MAG TPA: hypothetical protein VN931_05705 [Fibrobacteria bacterium]|nr:hypothetical protein [Fibrobacteria bacterium]